MMKTLRGDVVLVLFPNSDLRTAKRRPALVLQRDELGGGLSQTIVAMISSNLARRGHPSRIFISRDSAERQDRRFATGLCNHDRQSCDDFGIGNGFCSWSFAGNDKCERGVEAHAGFGLSACELTAKFPPLIDLVAKPCADFPNCRNCHLLPCELQRGHRQTSRKILFDTAAKVRQRVRELTAKFPLPY